MAANTETRAPEENLLDTLHSGQEAVVDLAQRCANEVGEIVPGLWSRPVVEGVPAPQELSDRAFGLAREVLDAQHDFTRRLVDSVLGELKKLGEDDE
jgi:hypothetical protein